MKNNILLFLLALFVFSACNQATEQDPLANATTRVDPIFIDDIIFVGLVVEDETTCVDIGDLFLNNTWDLVNCGAQTCTATFDKSGGVTTTGFSPTMTWDYDGTNNETDCGHLQFTYNGTTYDATLSQSPGSATLDLDGSTLQFSITY